MAFNLNVFDFSMATVLDDFASFMHQVQIPGDILSPTCQVLPPFFPEISLSSPVSTAERTSASDWSRDLGTQGTACSDLLSVLSPYGSRLPSLQPEDKPPTKLHSGRGPKDHLAISTGCRDHLVRELLCFSNCVPSDFVLPSKHALSRFISPISTFSITITHSSISPHCKWTI